LAGTKIYGIAYDVSDVSMHTLPSRCSSQLYMFIVCNGTCR